MQPIPPPNSSSSPQATSSGEKHEAGVGSAAGNREETSEALPERGQKAVWIRLAGRTALIPLGMFLLLVDYLKSGGAITSWLPQTEAWDRVNTAAFAIESFLAYNIGNLLPWRLAGVLGLLCIAGLAYAIVKSGKRLVIGDRSSVIGDW